MDGGAVKRPNRRAIFGTLVLGILLLGGIVFYYRWEGENYVGTEDAYVRGRIVYIVPTELGTLESWRGHTGQYFKRGDVLGTELVTPADPDAPGPSGVPVEAPISGVVVKNDAAVGATVSPNLGALAAMVNLDRLWVTAYLRETDAGRVRIGQPVTVTVDQDPGLVFRGRVEAIENASEASLSLLPDINAGGTFTKVTQRVPVKIKLFGYRGHGLRPGLSTEVTIDVRR